MNWNFIHKILRFLLVVIGTFLSIYLFFLLAKLTYPFIIGICLALLMNPFVEYMTRRLKFPRGLAVLLSMLIVVCVIAGIVTLLITQIVSSATYLSENIPDQLNTIITFSQNFFKGNILPFYKDLISIFDNLESGQQDTIMTNISGLGTNLGETIVDFLQTLLSGIPTFIAWLPNAATGIIFSLLATFFIAKDWHKLLNWADYILPDKATNSAVKVFNDLKKALFGIIRAQLTLISITAIIVMIGLVILRVHYSITIALLIGLVDLLPYLGTGAVFIPWIIFELITGDIKLTIGLSILYIVVLVQRQFIEPKVLSSSIGMDPLATLVSIFVGFKLVGFLGLIIGPIILVVVTTLYKANVFRDAWDYIVGKKPPTIIQK